MDTFDNRLDEKIHLYLEEAKNIADDEDLMFGDEDLPEMGKEPMISETISEMAAEINKALSIIIQLTPELYNQY